MSKKSDALPSSRWNGVPHDSDIDCSNDVPLVKQEFKDDCDVNVIIARCLKNGTALPVHETVTPVFMDVSAVGDLRTMMHTVAQAQDAFNSMDAGLRNRFKNDPAMFMDFIGDDSNYDEAVKLGLLKPEAPASAKPEAPPKPEAKPKPQPKGQPKAVGDDGGSSES